MKKGYKLCPYCGEEIKKEAVKCMYCKEFLDKEEVKEEIKEAEVKTIEENKDNSCEKKNDGGKLNWLWSILLVVVLFLIGVYAVIPNNKSQSDRKQALNNYYDNLIDMVNSTGDISRDDVANLLEQRQQGTDQHYNDVMSNLSEFLLDYYDTINSLDILGIDDYSQISDKTLINKIVSNWEIYKEYQKKGLDLIEELSADPAYGWDAYDLREKYTTRDTIMEMKGYFSNLMDFANTNIDLYSYLSTLTSNDYYVGSDGTIYFYDDYKLNKFNDLTIKQAAGYDNYEKTVEQHNNYTKNKAEYNKSLLNK